MRSRPPLPSRSSQQLARRWQALRREWRTLATGLAIDESVAARFTAADTQMAAREKEAQESDARVRRDALARIQQLLARVEPLPANSDVTLKTIDRALRDLRGLQSSMPSLPSKQDFDDVSARIKTAIESLTPKASELREAEDWKRFANVSIQEQLIVKMEALKTVEDLDAAAREVRELQEQWRAAADVPRAQSRWLWKRYKAAHDEVWARCETFFAAQQEQRTENLAKKIALCEQAEALAESTQWIQTAEAIKKLQAEWKRLARCRAARKGDLGSLPHRVRSLLHRRRDDLALAQGRLEREPGEEGSALRPGRSAGAVRATGIRPRPRSETPGGVEDDRPGEEDALGGDLAALPWRLRHLLRTLRPSSRHRTSGASGRA